MCSLRLPPILPSVCKGHLAGPGVCYPVGVTPPRLQEQVTEPPLERPLLLVVTAHISVDTNGQVGRQWGVRSARVPIWSLPFTSL